MLKKTHKKTQEEFDDSLDGDLGEHPLLILLPGELRQFGEQGIHLGSTWAPIELTEAFKGPIHFAEVF